jgi:hypothetical protein
MRLLRRTAARNDYFPLTFPLTSIRGSTDPSPKGRGGKSPSPRPAGPLTASPLTSTVKGEGGNLKTRRASNRTSQANLGDLGLRSDAGPVLAQEAKNDASGSFTGLYKHRQCCASGLYV